MSGGGNRPFKGKMVLSAAGSRKSLELSESELAQLEKDLDEVRNAVPARSYFLFHYHFLHFEALCLRQYHVFW